MGQAHEGRATKATWPEQYGRADSDGQAGGEGQTRAVPSSAGRGEETHVILTAVDSLPTFPKGRDAVCVTFEKTLCIHVANRRMGRCLPSPIARGMSI